MPASVSLRDGGLTGAISVSPNDTTDLDPPLLGLYVGVAGNVRVTMLNGDVVTLVGILGGQIHRLMIRRVHNTGTTALNIHGFY